MATPPTTMPAAARVLVDASLFRHIVAFQHGLEMALLALWRAHKPASEPLRLDRETISTLAELLVEHGTLAHVRMAERARCCAEPETSLWGSAPGARASHQRLPLQRVAEMALVRNRIDIAEWALESKCSKVVFPVEAWCGAIARANEDGGDTRALELLHKYAPLETKTHMDRIADSIPVDLQHVSILRLLVEAFPQMSARPHMVTLAAAHGDLATVQHLHARDMTVPHDRFGGLADTTHNRIRIDGVVSARHLDVLAFLLEHFDQHLNSSDLVELASSTEPEIHQVALRFAEKLQDACVEYINGCTARLEQVQQWVATRILSPQWPISIDTIASHGLLDMVRLLHEHGIATATTDAMDQAAEKGRWDVVEFLHFHRSEGCTTRAMDAALVQANLKYVLFLREHCKVECSPQAAEKAACNSSTATLRFLHAHTDVAFSPTVMDTAAAYGNLAAVQFLHENRSEGCTTAAMDSAAFGGHLRVIQYLHTHRSEGCTFAALRGAIQNGRLHVVRFLFHNYRHLFECDEFNQDLVTKAVTWGLRFDSRRGVVKLLFDHFPSLFSPRLLQQLLVRGMFDMYQAIRSRNPNYSSNPDATEDRVIESALQEAGRTFQLRTIRYIVEVLGRRDLAYRAMDGAAEERHCGTHWLRAVYAIAGPQSCRLSAVLVAVRVAVGKRCSLDRVKFLIRVCCEPDAKQAAIKRIPPYADAALVAELANWDPTTDDDTEASQQPLHPFLLDPRVKSWAIREVFNCSPKVCDPLGRGPRTWAAAAAYQHDVAMLEVIRDTPATPDYTHSNHGETTDVDAARGLWRYEGAHAVAIYAGSLKALQWLLTNVDLPVVPTLLDEALFYDRREIAEWLVAHHPEACTEVQWETTHRENYMKQFWVSEDLVNWLEATPAVRNALDFGGIVGYLVQQNDAESLRRLHGLDPALVFARRDLATLAKQSNKTSVEDFLREIGYASA